MLRFTVRGLVNFGNKDLNWIVVHLPVNPLFQSCRYQQSRKLDCPHLRNHLDITKISDHFATLFPKHSWD